MTAPRFLTHKEAVAAGWFSRRHETDEAHREARTEWRASHGAAARRARVAERARAASATESEAA